MLSIRKTVIPTPQAAELYENAFPFCERRTLQHHISTAGKNPAFFPGELYAPGGEFVGILYYWHWPELSLLFVEHLAIVPHLRGKGFGHAALQLVTLPDTCVILEIEPVTDEPTARRLDFYESAGFIRLPYAHVQLPYHPGGESVPLELLSWQENQLAAALAQINLLEHMLRTQVMP